MKFRVTFAQTVRMHIDIEADDTNQAAMEAFDMEYSKKVGLKIIAGRPTLIGNTVLEQILENEDVWGIQELDEDGGTI